MPRLPVTELGPSTNNMVPAGYGQCANVKDTLKYFAKLVTPYENLNILC
jgi:hypothetical protein